MSDESRVIAAIGERRADIADLLAELIRFDTTTRGEPDEPARDEEPLQARLAAILEAAGAEVELWEPTPGELDRWPRQVPEGLTFAGRPQMLAREVVRCSSTDMSTSSRPSLAGAGRATRSPPRSATGVSTVAVPAT